MDKEYAKYLLDKTQADYNRIASHFSNTRKYIWQDLEYFKKFVDNGDKILDLGCGNGRLLKLLKDKDIDYIGIDSSKRLIEIARKSWTSHARSIKFIVADVLDLPFQNNSFDKIFSIAVFHHIPSKKFRLEFLKQAKSVLKPNGLLILTAWNLQQKRFLKYHLKYFLLKLIGKSKLDFKDIFYPWKSQQGKVLAQRYIHCFTKNELKNLAKKAGFKIQEIGFLGKQKRNIYLVARVDKNI